MVSRLAFAFRMSFDSCNAYASTTGRRCSIISGLAGTPDEQLSFASMGAAVVILLLLQYSQLEHFRRMVLLSLIPLPGSPLSGMGKRI
jgi:hypothetical protein